MDEQRSRFRELLISGIKQGFPKLGKVALQVSKGTLLAGLLGTAALPVLLAGAGLDTLTKALTDLVGWQGANLLSNRLEGFFTRWRKDKGKPPDETEITEYIKQEMEHEAEFRQTVLDLLMNLETASIFKDIL
ncbi:MAG: hypothetical protein DLM69_11615 [Candidatus Chloroheliales bacterium]|nr:MAG: hypothetical protein DLM69_11615 [Chloroflexota bacterium]